jgi:hypothetical protein
VAEHPSEVDTNVMGAIRAHRGFDRACRESRPTDAAKAMLVEVTRDAKRVGSQCPNCGALVSYADLEYRGQFREAGKCPGCGKWSGRWAMLVAYEQPGPWDVSDA